MAERRMFTKKVTDDDNFMALSSSAQALYLHLSMSADDDGFCNQVSVAMFKAHASIQDLQSLLEKRYIYQFENGVIVIKHWRMANALRKDRYTPTAFQEELSKLQLKSNGSYTWLPNGCQMVADCLPQDSIGKNSIDKNSIGKNIPPFIPPEEKSKTTNDEIETMLNETAFSDYLKDGIREWLSYKREKGQTYKPKGFKTLLTKITNQLSVESEADIVNDIQECMSRNYAGIFYGTSKKQTVKGQQTTQDWVKQWEDA